MVIYNIQNKRVQNYKNNYKISKQLTTNNN